jgi:hypothetical protein
VLDAGDPLLEAERQAGCGRAPRNLQCLFLNSVELLGPCGCLHKTDCRSARTLLTVRACLLRLVFLSSDTSFDVTLVSLSRYGA